MRKQDLREWITRIEATGDIQTLKGANWDLEIGAITYLSKYREDIGALLFDEIKGYPKGYRVLTNSLKNLNHLLLTLGVKEKMGQVDFVRYWKERIPSLSSIPPKVVKDGPVMENVFRGGDIDMLKFPTPRWHELDGGRYLGTGCVVITRDPDEGWVNLGTYRIMVHDNDTLGFYISPGKQGRIHREKDYAKGRPCKVAISFGHDPLVFLAGTLSLPWGYCEYDWMGGVIGEPTEVIEGEYTGLPFPATSEIVIEGDSFGDVLVTEGPFGEWTGYYGSSSRVEPVVKVKNLFHRNDPIILGSPPKGGLKSTLLGTSILWDQIEKAGISDVKGVWTMQEAGAHLIIVVSIKQRYPGHASMAGHVATQCRAGGYLGRYTIVVDDDIDPSNVSDVLWAIATRSDPVKDIDIIRRAWSSPLDPIIPKGEKGHNSRAIIDATRPYEWIDEFPAVVGLSPELKKITEEKWKNILF